MKKTLLFGMMLVCSALFMNVSAAEPKVDAATYANKVDGKFTFENKWIYSNKENNYLAADLLAPTANVRGMAVKNGKMLFIDRSTKSILVINGQTGAKETPLKLADNFFKFLGKTKDGTADSLWTAGVLTHNDIHVDNAGNVLVGNLTNMDPGAKNRRFQVWKVNMTDGTGTVVIDAQMDELFPIANIRFDAFGVWGDINGRAVIMAANANAMEVYKWDIVGGVVPAKPILIEVDNTATAGYLKGLPSPGLAPRVFPLDENYFYLDGQAIYPTLIDKDGNYIDDFSKKPSALKDSVTVDGKIINLNQAPNGIKDFDLGGEYFTVMGATNTDGNPGSAFRIYKFADGAKAYSGLDVMWTFPQIGLGAASNSHRTAMPQVEVNGNTAYIYFYYGENGYGMYEMKYVPTGLSRTQVSDVTITLNNNKILISESVKSAEVYSISGMRLAFANNVSEIAAPTQKGIYLVSIVDNSGAKKVQKVAVH